jgi:hypothetical protein
MRIRHRAALLAAVSGIALSGAIATAPAMAADKPAPAPATTSPTMTFAMRGTVASLDGLKLAVAGDSGQNLVTVAPNAAVTVDGTSAKLSQLPIGAQVAVSGTVTGGVKVATRVEANTVRPFAAAGSVSAVDGTARTLTVTPLAVGGPTVAKAYPVAAKALIILDGKPVDLAKLPVRAHILVAGTVTGGVFSAQSLTAVSRWDLKLSGTVTAVDAAHSTVTVSTGSPATAVKLNVDPNVGIQVNGVKASLATLPIGATVNLSGTETTAGTSISGIDAKVSGKTR